MAMKRNSTNYGGTGGRVFARLAAEKKKLVVALVLVSLMAVMWVRVLLRKGPENAAAGTQQVTIDTTQPDRQPKLKLSFIELPRIQGRNDSLGRDFFVSNRWQDFIRDRNSGVSDVSVVSKQGDAEVARRVAAKLRLQAIWLGENPQVVINDRPLSRADRFIVKEGSSTYECEVVSIEENKVVINCGQAQIELRLSSATGVHD